MPIIDMLDVTARGLRERGLARIALFGTRFTIETALFGALDAFDVVSPRTQEIDEIHRVYLDFDSRSHLPGRCQGATRHRSGNPPTRPSRRCGPGGDRPQPDLRRRQRRLSCVRLRLSSHQGDPRPSNRGLADNRSRSRRSLEEPNAVRSGRVPPASAPWRPWAAPVAPAGSRGARRRRHVATQRHRLAHRTRARPRRLRARRRGPFGFLPRLSAEKAWLAGPQCQHTAAPPPAVATPRAPASGQC